MWIFSSAYKSPEPYFITTVFCLLRTWLNLNSLWTLASLLEKHFLLCYFVASEKGMPSDSLFHGKNNTIFYAFQRGFLQLDRKKWKIFTLYFCFKTKEFYLSCKNNPSVASLWFCTITLSFLMSTLIKIMKNLITYILKYLQFKLPMLYCTNVYMCICCFVIYIAVV